MKVIDNHFDKAPLLKVYLIGVLIFGTFTFLLFQFISPMLTVEGKNALTTIVDIKISVAVGLIFGLMWLLMVTGSRSNSKFWRYAEAVEKLVEDADTKQTLKDIYANEFKELKHLAQGGPHYYEAKRIYAILETKHKYIKD